MVVIAIFPVDALQQGAVHPVDPAAIACENLLDIEMVGCVAVGTRHGTGLLGALGSAPQGGAPCKSPPPGNRAQAVANASSPASLRDP